VTLNRHGWVIHCLFLRTTLVRCMPISFTCNLVRYVMLLGHRFNNAQYMVAIGFLLKDFRDQRGCAQPYGIQHPKSTSVLVGICVLTYQVLMCSILGQMKVIE
jgi:hypothetical protein